MKHSHIEGQQIVERYVRNQLDDAQRDEFEAHFFECDECFMNLQTMERFIAGVRYGAEAGLISANLTEPQSYFSLWFKPAFAITAVASVVLTAVVVWLAFVRVPELRDQITRERSAREELETRKQREIDELNVRLANQPVSNGQTIASANTTSQSQAEGAKRKTNSDTSELIARNVPLVVLEATRGADETNHIKMSPDASHFACWIEVGPSVPSQNFHVEAFNESGGLVALISEIRKNSKGAVVATFPAEKFPAGEYRLRLYRLPKSDSSLIGEFKLRIDK